MRLPTALAIALLCVGIGTLLAGLAARSWSGEPLHTEVVDAEPENGGGKRKRGQSVRVTRAFELAVDAGMRPVLADLRVVGGGARLRVFAPSGRTIYDQAHGQPFGKSNIHVPALEPEESGVYRFELVVDHRAEATLALRRNGIEFGNGAFIATVVMAMAGFAMLFLPWFARMQRRAIRVVALSRAAASGGSDRA